MKRLWLIVLVIWSTVPSEGLAQGWSDVVDPAPGPPRAVGTYTAGCVQGAVALPPEGPGFQTMRRYRRRWIVERTFAWLGYFRRLTVRYARLLATYGGFFHLACALLVLRRVLK